MLLGFAGALGYTARRAPLGRVEPAVLTVMDVGYVLASVVLVVAWPDLLSAAGRLAVVGVAAVVAGLVATQLLGLRRLSAA